jgi:hypothetical protein
MNMRATRILSGFFFVSNCLSFCFPVVDQASLDLDGEKELDQTAEWLSTASFSSR